MLAISLSASAATLSTDGSLSDTQTKINSAGALDTIQLPAASPFTWANTLYFTNGLILDCNNSTITHGASGKTLVMMKTHATNHRYLLNGKFSMSTIDRALNIDGTAFSNARFQVTNCYFTSSQSGSIMVESALAWGVFSRCHFAAPQNSEHIHNIAYGAPGTAGWQDDVIPGTIDQIYLEDCTWTNNDTFGNPANFLGNSCVQGYYGCRTTVRFCTMNMSEFDNHGGGSPNLGGRWFEVYSNTFVCVANANQDRYMGLRSGSGVIYGNQKVGAANAGSGDIDFALESGDNTACPPGLGKNFANEPIYCWNNSANMTITHDSTIVINSNLFLSAKSPYTPLAYPHPDLSQSASSSTTTTFGVVSGGSISVK